MYHYKIKTSIKGIMKTIDHLNHEELQTLNSFKYNNLQVIRNDGNIVEYIKQNGVYIVSNKFKQKGF